MNRTLRDLASPENSALYPNIQMNDDSLGTSYKTFSIYLKSQLVNIYRVACAIANCFVCENSNCGCMLAAMMSSSAISLARTL